MTRSERVLEGAAVWGSFYRENVDKFVEEYLHVNLHLFQRIVLVMMFWSTTMVFIASRGLGKTFLSAIYCVVRCILYPGTRVCIAASVRSQSINVLEKITQELVPRSPELRAEIDWKETTINATKAMISFKNSSVIKVVTAGETARGNRANVVLVDEFRLVNKDTIDTILKKFLTLTRQPDYRALSKEERKREWRKEKNLTMYLSSAYWKEHWAYQKCVDTLKAMVNPRRRQFVCSFPYQLPIAEGMLDPEFVADEMADSDFSEIKFSMEMEALFFGSSGSNFFNYDSVVRNRYIKYPMLPDKLSIKLKDNAKIRIPPKTNGEIRIMSADIALMSSSKHNNDATAVWIDQMLPTKAGRYSNSIVYGNAYEGLRTEEQALVIRKLFDEYSCDYLVLDTNGIGLGVYDSLSGDLDDPETGEIYPALSCCNDDNMAARCTVPGARKAIWSIKGSAQFNSDCAVLLRDALHNNRIRLLVNEYDGEENLSALKGYNNLTPAEKMALQMPYIHTTLLINELTKLQHEQVGSRIRVFEQTGMRKDRYSSLAYCYYVATQLGIKESRRHNKGSAEVSMYQIRAPKRHTDKGGAW